MRKANPASEPVSASLNPVPASGSSGHPGDSAVSGRVHRLLQRRLLQPILDLLRVGATPEKLAWSLAIGVACGINPLLGSTTVVCFVVAIPLRLNLVAAQIANHLVYPLELALFFVFIRMGRALFGAPPLPFTREALLHRLLEQPWETTRTLWSWEWHALLAWLLCSLVLVPLLALALMPPLRTLARRRATRTA